VLGAGVHGIKKAARLDMGEAKVPAALMKPQEREKLNIRDRLPASPKEARERFVQDTVIVDMLGDIGKIWKVYNEVRPFLLIVPKFALIIFHL
jgi:glutamine synthetase